MMVCQSRSFGSHGVLIGFLKRPMRERNHEFSRVNALLLIASTSTR